MVDIDPFADISSLPFPLSLNNLHMDSELSHHPQEYFRELQLTNYPTRYLFDQLLEVDEQLVPTIVNQKKQQKGKKVIKRQQQANLNQLSLKAEKMGNGVQKYKRIVKLKKVVLGQCKSMTTLPKMSLQMDKQQRRIGLRRRKVKIQQSVKQQNNIQPTRLKRTYRKTKKSQSITSLLANTGPKVAESVSSLKEQFENYLNLS